VGSISNFRNSRRKIVLRIFQEGILHGKGKI
jgi:hypothetical protein